MQQEIEQKKKIIKIINKYRDEAVKEQKKIPFAQYENYYRGNSFKIKNINNYNIVKSLIDTKTTLVLDNNITTSIIPKNISFANQQSIKDMYDIADILNDAKNEVFKNNSIKTFYERICKRAIKTNIGIAKVYWDDTIDKLGDVKIQEINPESFYPDPHASSIDDCNYLYIECHYSILTLKQKYPHLATQIDLLAERQKLDKENYESDKMTKGIITTTAAENTTQMYIKASDVDGIEGLKSNKDNIRVWECYIKDDSIFIPQKQESKDDLALKESIALKYPQGRVIIYHDDGIIFEDKPIDYPFGFPFTIFYENPGDSIIPLGGTVRDLVFIQDRINKAYERIRELLGKFLSTVVIDVASGLNKNDIYNSSVIQLDPESLPKGLMPQVLTNNTISEITTLTAYIDRLKQDAKEIARVNEQMISGQRPQGVTSGEMVSALNESAMTSIRQIQRNFSEFLIDLTNKVIVLIQKYYNLERFIRISTGEIIKIPQRLQEEQREEQEPIQIYDFKDDIIKQVKIIKSDLLDYEYKTEIIAGSEMPKTRSQSAQLTMQLLERGVIGDQNNIETKKLILDSFDFPNRRAIIKELENQNKDKEKQEQETPPEVKLIQTIERMGFNFKDLESWPEAQRELLVRLGLLKQEQQLPMQEQTPQEQMPQEQIIENE